ncbi:hypothetical protein OF83DRAFT_1068992 [Amylostereum chailletii]|nr:hypothetical protein OF83DRAFT_1068992 [Amylostereum chailletii]
MEDMYRVAEAVVAARGKDVVGKADFALQSSGASVVPSLTSPTLGLRMCGLRAAFVAWVTGKDYTNISSRPPIHALHHDTHSGYCWCFPGEEGQLGVQLAHTVHIEEVTVDHLALELAWDMRSAPRTMELWGLVEGHKNEQKLHSWEETHRRERQTLSEGSKPFTGSKSSNYIRVASFEYNIAAHNPVQTFPVSEDVRKLGIPFRVVIFRVVGNWGHDHTCLFRVRVHGQKDSVR